LSGGFCSQALYLGVEMFGDSSQRKISKHLQSGT
jgi:hypothetical protein